METKHKYISTGASQNFSSVSLQQSYLKVYCAYNNEFFQRFDRCNSHYQALDLEWKVYLRLVLKLLSNGNGITWCHINLAQEHFEFNIFHWKTIQLNVFLVKMLNINMIIRIIGLVFLFIMCIRFPLGN